MSFHPLRRTKQLRGSIHCTWVFSHVQARDTDFARHTHHAHQQVEHNGRCFVFRVELAQWQESLANLTDALTEQPVPEHVWQGINARIEPQVLHIPEKRPFWNWLRVTAAIGSLVVAVALGVIYNRDSARYSATLLNADAQPALKVEAHEDYLKVEALSLAAVDQGRSLELWAIPADGKPIALAVSLEPKGGSPTGQPTGPVLYQGALAAL